MLIPAAATSAMPLRPLGALRSRGGPFDRQSGNSFAPPVTSAPVEGSTDTTAIRRRYPLRRPFYRAAARGAVRRPGRRRGSRRGTSPPASGSRACRRRRSRPPRPPRRGPGSASPSAPSTRHSRSVSSPPSVLRVRMWSRTAISGPAFGSSRRCGAATRMILSPRYWRAPRIGDDLRVLGEGVRRPRGRGRAPRARPARR